MFSFVIPQAELSEISQIICAATEQAIVLVGFLSQYFYLWCIGFLVIRSGLLSIGISLRSSRPMSRVLVLLGLQNLTLYNAVVDLTWSSLKLK